jgi:hypothetical protein
MAKAGGNNIISGGVWRNKPARHQRQLACEKRQWLAQCNGSGGSANVRRLFSVISNMKANGYRKLLSVAIQWLVISSSIQ